MNLRSRMLLAAVAALAAFSAIPASAGSFGSDSFSGGSSFAPRVPVSALARQAAWFDPSRMHISTSVSVGSGFGGGTNALQVTSLSYQFGTPLAMRVNLGNAWGPNSLRGNNGAGFFLEGLDVAYRPFGNLQVNVSYKDIRSPLQYSSDPTSGFWSR